MKLIAAIITLSATTAAAASFGDADRGRAMASEICAECHNIELAPEVERADAPRSFTAIARDPVYTDQSLRVFFSTPHQQMPDFIFTREQQDDLIAYIMDMRGKLKAD